jgi:hypothetical protein
MNKLMHIRLLSQKSIKMSAVKNMSLFIPHVFPSFTEEYVELAFEEVGDVDRVDFVAKQDRDGKHFNAVYVHFKKWHNNSYTSEIQASIAKNGSTKFYHSDSWYWIVLPNTTKKHTSGADRKPRIDIGEDKVINVKSVEQKATCPPPTPVKETCAEEKPLVNTEFEEYLQLLRLPIEDWDVESSEQALEMDDIEAELEADDENLVSVDWRYIKTIEEENMYLHCEIAQLRQAVINLDQMYQSETAKVRALSKEEGEI